jgi:hypothetical protein
VSLDVAHDCGQPRRRYPASFRNRLAVATDTDDCRKEVMDVAGREVLQFRRCQWQCASDCAGVSDKQAQDFD